MAVILPSRFGELLHHLRKRAGVTQRELATATGYSFSLISSLERGSRLPQVDSIAEKFVPALGLQAEPHLAAKLLQEAAHARGERPPTPLPFSPTQTMTVAHPTDEPAHLPLPLTPIIGRDADVKMLCNRLAQPHSRLLTLTGPPGVGKTRLALTLAEQIEPLYRNGAKFIPLATVLEPAELEVALAAAFDLAYGGLTSPQARLISHLRRQELLLLLDNFEQLLPPSGGRANAATKLVVNLLDECPGLQIIATSRERLHLRGESRHRVAPLTLDRAAILFLERVQQLESTSFQEQYDLSLIHQICQQLDCLPLALELAAAHADVLSPRALLMHVREHRLDTLVDSALDLPDHQRTLRDAIQSSYVLLSEAEQRLFCCLSIFVGKFSAEAAATFGSTPALLETLMSKSLLASALSKEEVSFSMLETLREFGHEQLRASGQLDAVRRRHARYYQELAQEAALHMRGRAKVAWLERLEQEHSNIRTSLQSMLTHEPESALAFVVNLDEFWLIRGHVSEAIGWLEQVLDASQDPTVAQGLALLLAANCYRRLANYVKAEDCLAYAKQVGAELDNVTLRLKFYRCAGWYLYDRHQVEQAVEHFHAGLMMAREHAVQPEIARFLLAKAHLQRCHVELRPQVIAALDESLRILNGLDEPESEAFLMQQYGELEVSAGHYSSAAGFYAKALELHQALSNKSEMAWALEQLAEVAWFQDDVALAESYLEQSYALFVQLHHPEGTMISQYHLGQVARRQQQCSVAYSFYSQSLHSARTLGNQHMIARNLAGLGSLALLQDDSTCAAYLLGAAEKLFRLLPQFLAPVDYEEHQQQIAMIQAQISEPQIANAWQKSQSESAEQVAATVFSLLY